MKLAVVLLLVGIVAVSCIPQRGGGGGGRGGRRRGPKACKDNGGIDTCECKDGSTCEGDQDCNENCGKRSGNPLVSCTCADGEPWTKREKPSKRGRPCGRRNKPISCTCEDGETYEEDIKENCDKDDNPPQECECENGDTWVAEEE